MIFLPLGEAKMSKNVRGFARIHFSALATYDRFWTRFRLDFGRVWAPFWEVFRSQERKSGVPERFEKDGKKEGDKKSCG